MNKDIEMQLINIEDHLKMIDLESHLSDRCLQLLRGFSQSTFKMEDANIAVFNLVHASKDDFLEKSLTVLLSDIKIYLQQPKKIQSDSVDWGEFFKLNY